MKKIVFFDIDGTLLNKQNKIPQSTKDAINTLRENGVYVAIATGRAPQMFEDIREELNIDSYISNNGQYVVFEGKEIYTNPMHTEALHMLAEDAATHKHPMLFTNEKEVIITHEDHPHVNESYLHLGLDYPAVNKDYYKDNDLFQCCVFCEKGEEQFYMNKYPQFDFIRWHDLSIDVLPKGGSKAEGIAKMLELTGFTQENTYAFGDGLNDLEMIAYVGTGVAMGNAVEPLKEVANHITTSSCEDGIYHALKTFDLI
ncbi:Cof-type HAD-IIB family hydrolase [Priestia taiwanensis]|uniref:Phosphatase n=1 Tax=Priestia taiwanensis TaxID=1347902 RepID=A0A917EQV9_9BACI|nr:Cof-type HAD-IIB family hydrolase [Priestia taiwanensis]MBM7364287.1 Cof subfamily protein (haloacid dehalogenase superfamily) [Priestia taiwanensis]GGE73217.1 phosphatase [Priestia taiwanensis]